MTAMRKNSRTTRLYLGVDVGGTKILGALVEESGRVIGRQRGDTPSHSGRRSILSAIRKVMDGVLQAQKVRARDLTAIGLAIPGVVDPDQGKIIVTPNMNLTGTAIVSAMERRFGVPVALGNDVNLGTLGEHWLGSARRVESAFGIFVGTGIGGGLVRNGEVWRGFRESAAEIGHIVMEIKGPRCGCGNRGCLEALASRTAIERTIRQAVKAGEKTVLTKLLEGDLRVIRSGALRRALDQHDRLVLRVLRRAAEVLGYACLTVRHLVDPEVIVLGGGVVEACGDFIVPIVRTLVKADRLPGAREGGRVVRSALGDDAVMLGAVALARQHVGRSPFCKPFVVQPEYAAISRWRFGKVAVGDTTYDHDIYIRADGKVKDRKRCPRGRTGGPCHKVNLREIQKVSKGGPEVLFIGTGRSGRVVVAASALKSLRAETIEVHALPTPQAIKAYNGCRRRKAILLHVTC
jgi:glucokinase